MKLREIKNKTQHYFVDEQDLIQGHYNLWHENGQLWINCHLLDSNRHGEAKEWIYSGELLRHRFFINGEIIIDFKKNPELYPTTPEEKTMFVLKYGNAPFIGDSSEIT